MDKGRGGNGKEKRGRGKGEIGRVKGQRGRGRMVVTKRCNSGNNLDKSFRSQQEIGKEKEREKESE